MPWATPFDEPIRLRRGGRLTTLQHAADYIMKLPEDVQQQQRWQIAVENLINAAETGGGWLMFARIGVLRWTRTVMSVAIPQAAAADPSLFQRRIHRGELAVEGAADAVDGGDDHDAEADRDQAIFDSGCAGFIIQEF